MSTLLALLIVLACPLMMILMMRGMHGGQAHQAAPPPSNETERSEDPAITARIAELERELAEVRTVRDEDTTHRDESSR